ncbi:hypothetical protein AX16_001107 [Volvariella volvacea WC 439]|nr:hypothetical protein AX16_001107 [Volvariella volvacea WC 439]
MRKGNNWRHLQDKEWLAFHQSWWGVELEPSAIITIPQVTVAINLVDRTGFRKAQSFLIREEYISMYNRAADFFDWDDAAVVISGSPGIGKSVGLLYYLRRRMAENIATTSLQISDIPDTSPSVLALIDASEQAPKAPHRDLILSRANLIFASSLDESAYKPVLELRRGVVWYIQPWSPNEIKDALRLQPWYARSKTAERLAISSRLDDVMSRAGPFDARRFFEALQYPNTFESKLSDGLSQIQRRDFYYAVADCRTSPDSVFHRLLAIFRVHHNKRDSDIATIQFTSSYIATRVR